MPAESGLTLGALLALGRGGEPDRFITLASAALAAGVTSDPLRILLIQCLAERGLRSRAAALATGLSPAVRESAAYADLRRGLQGGGAGGRVPWARFAAQFAANVQVLRERYEWADDVAAAWQAGRAGLELHVTSDQRFQVFEPAGPGGFWRPFFGNHLPAPPTAELAARFKNQVLAPFLLDGVGLGYHLPWLYEATAATFLGASACIYQVEPSFPALAVALHLHDWRALLADPRVRLCCGPRAGEQFEAAVRADLDNAPPAAVLRISPWYPDRPATACDRLPALVQQHEAERAALQAEVAALYRGRGPAWWAQRYEAALRGGGPPLRILGVTSRFTTVLQYSMRDALAGLRAAGCQTRLLIEPDRHSRHSPRRCLGMLREFQPDLVLLIDHTRQRQRAGLIDDVPVVTWVQDRLPWLFDRATGAALGSLDFCMGFGFAELVQRCGYPAERFLPCQMATDPTAFWPPGESPDPEARPPADDPLACEIAYATHAPPPPDELARGYRTRCAAELHPLVAALHDELSAAAGCGKLNGDLDRPYFLRQRGRARGLALSSAQLQALDADYLRPLLDSLLRHQTAGWAADWAEAAGGRFHLYGHGWERHPRLARYARGFVPHGPELGRALRAAKINLHAGCNLALHQRVLDGLAAGGFFLIRRHGGDLCGPVLRGIYELARRRGLRPGARVFWSDLPPPLDQQCAAMLRSRGHDPADPIELTAEDLLAQREMYETGGVAVAGDLWPQLECVTFDSQAQFNERVAFFLADAEARRAAARDMRQRVLATCTYEALMRRLLEWLRRGLHAAAAEVERPTGQGAGHGEIARQQVGHAESASR